MAADRQDAAAEAIADRIIPPAMEKERLPGLALGVVKDGRVVVEKGYGVKSFESGQVPDADTVFYIGSLSKAVTAVGAMMLVEQGKIDLSAPAGDYLKGLPENWRPITVRQFMAHQSGIPQLNQKLPTFEEMLQSAKGKPLKFQPGAKQEYNNFNFAVVGKIIAAVNGLSYLDYMKQNVFGPLGMEHTGSGIVAPNEAAGYSPGAGRPAPIAHEIKGGEYGIPSGHLQSTLADLLKLYQAIRTNALLKPATCDLMVTRVNPAMGGTLGWFERMAGEDSLVAKNGATQGFHSIMTFVSGKGDCVVMLWTSQKPKGNSLFKETNELLNRICGVPVGPQAEPADDAQEE
ncbi:MAG: serine hydrolase [Candidatus Sumerlaeota bacterium]|nr:serine hydrolase [Candidatus Sumerlaeota bacterium]